MAEDLIRYDILAQEALRSVVRRVLVDAAKNGLPGEHHFFITFETNAPGVKLSPRLREQYPEDMTIVLQHQFWDLFVRDDEFEVGLSFNKIAEKIVIPYSAIKAFFDPSVQFGLQFEMIEEDFSLENLPVSPAEHVANVKDKVRNINSKATPADKDKDNAPVELPVRKAEKKPAKKLEAAKKADSKSDDAQERPTAEIVSLDRFRKKTD